MNSSYNIIIIGGGLAGLTAAIDLRLRGYEVLLIEKREYPFHKVCGEYISNEVKPYLQRLGAYPENLSPKAINRFEISAPSGRLAQCRMQMGGFGISRYALDNFLFERGQQLGVQYLLKTTATRVDFNGEHFKVQLKKGAILEANLVVGAHGKRSVIDKSLKRNFMSKRSHYIGVKQHYEADFPDDLVGLYNFPGGYCGLSRVENEHVNFCYLTKKEVFDRYNGLAEMKQNHLVQNPHLATFLERARPVFEKPLVISQIIFGAKPVVHQHMLMCGDAAGLIHPLCGNGMAMAIHGAQLCSMAVSDFLEHRINRQQMEDRYRQYWQNKFSQRLWFGHRAEQMLSRNSLTEWAVAAGNVFPAFLKRVVSFSHGNSIH